MSVQESATQPVRLSDLVDGQEAECFGALVRKTRGQTYKGDPFVKLLFRDKRTMVEAPVWADHRYFQAAQQWPEGEAYRLRAKASYNAKYGMQIDLLDVRPAGPDDVADGFDFFDLVESSERSPGELMARIQDCIQKSIDDPFVKDLVVQVLDEHRDLFCKLQAASSLHHSFTGGLLEHVWSMTRVASFLATHYARYYHDLNPPLNRSVIIAGAILHDIGKLRELEYHPVEARYTKEGRLIGHILMGRDMIRDAAKRIDGFPEETLLLLEHVILSHHGKHEFGAPVLPQTIEAMIVSAVDDLDAKINAVAREYKKAGSPDSAFTDKLYALEGRRMYRGLPVEQPGLPPADSE